MTFFKKEGDCGVCFLGKRNKGDKKKIKKFLEKIKREEKKMPNESERE